MAEHNTDPDPDLADLTSQRDTTKLGFGRFCLNLMKAYIAKIALCSLVLFTTVLAVIYIYYIHVYKVNENLGAPSAPESETATEWKITLKLQSTTEPNHSMQSHHRRMTDYKQQSVNKSQAEGFKLEYKKLYIFSRKGQTGESLKPPGPTALENVTKNTGLNSSSDLTEGEDPCSRSGIPENQMFDCSELVPSAGNIFFLETSCANSNKTKKRGDPALSEKIACSIYSAALHNPSRKVILLFTCPFPEGYNWTKDWTILFELPNFFFGRLVIADFYAGTPLSEFYHGPLKNSSYPIEHQADILRLIVLYFYGGTYLDIDHITLRSLDDLGVNFVSNQAPDGDNLLSNSGMNFEPNHPLLKSCLIKAIVKYVPRSWETVGPMLLTDAVKSRCDVSNEQLAPRVALTKLRSCNISILPEYFFYAIGWRNWEYFYRQNFWPFVRAALAQSYGTHYWNHMGKPPSLLVGSSQPLVRLAKKHCPPIYFNAGAVLS